MIVHWKLYHIWWTTVTNSIGNGSSHHSSLFYRYGYQNGILGCSMKLLILSWDVLSCSPLIICCFLLVYLQGVSRIHQRTRRPLTYPYGRSPFHAGQPVLQAATSGCPSSSRRRPRRTPVHLQLDPIRGPPGDVDWVLLQHHFNALRMGDRWPGVLHRLGTLLRRAPDPRRRSRLDVCQWGLHTTNHTALRVRSGCQPLLDFWDDGWALPIHLRVQYATGGDTRSWIQRHHQLHQHQLDRMASFPRSCHFLPTDPLPKGIPADPSLAVHRSWWNSREEDRRTGEQKGRCPSLCSPTVQEERAPCSSPCPEVRVRLPRHAVMDVSISFRELL